MQFDKNNPKKQRQLWKQVNDNEISVSDLKKAGIKAKSLIYSKDLFTFSGEGTEWASWLGLSPFTDVTVYKLKEFTEDLIPYLSSQLITRTIEDADGNPNQELLDDLESRILSIQYAWHYTYTIKAEEETTSSFAQEYKAENGAYPVAYYLVSYISIWFHNGLLGDDKVNYPLDYRQLITIDNLKYDEIIKDKS